MTGSAQTRQEEEQRTAKTDGLSRALGHADESLDRLTRLASRALDTPVALVSLVSSDEVQFPGVSSKEHHEALAARRLPHALSLCPDVVAATRPLIVDDLDAHPLGQAKPALRRLGVAAYAGVPLITADGYAVGSFCVLDQQPRQWTEAEIELLLDLARFTVREIELNQEMTEARRYAETLEHALDQRTAELQEASQVVERWQHEGRPPVLDPRTQAAAPADFGAHLFSAEMLPTGSFVQLTVAPLMERFLGLPVPDGVDPLSLWEACTPPEDLARIDEAYATLPEGGDLEIVYRLLGLDGVTRTILERARRRVDAQGRLLVDGLIVDVSVVAAEPASDDADAQA